MEIPILCEPGSDQATLLIFLDYHLKSRRFQTLNLHFKYLPWSDPSNPHTLSAASIRFWISALLLCVVMRPDLWPSRSLVDLQTIHQPRYWQLRQKRVPRSECLAHSRELITDVGRH